MSALRPALLCCAGLACALAAELLLPPELPDAGPPLPRVRRTTVLPAASGLEGWQDTVLERPLFSPTRTPDGTATTPAEPDALPRLTGVIVTPAGRTALFVNAAGARLALREGDAIANGAVKWIGKGEVLLELPKGERVVHPSFAAPKLTALAGVRP